MRFTSLVLLMAVTTAACADGAEDGPEDALARFIDLMDRSGDDPRALEEAYGLLDRAAQAELARRADKAEALSDRAFSPWHMLAEGRFRLRFAPVPGGMRTRMQGEQRAVVKVVGEGAGERLEVPLVRQGGRWRIVLELPGLAKRPQPGATVTP